MTEVHGLNGGKSFLRVQFPGATYIIKAIVTHEQVLHCLATSVTDREFKEPL